MAPSVAISVASLARMCGLQARVDQGVDCTWTMKITWQQRDVMIKGVDEVEA